MTSFETAAIIAGCTFGCGLAGTLLHRKLPAHHVDESSKDVIKLVMNLIATMAALVLSLLIASASSSYQAQESEVQSLSANMLLLDHVLVYYGPEARETRHLLRGAVETIHDRIWPPDAPARANFDPRVTEGAATAFVERLEGLKPATDAQRTLLSQAMQIGQGLALTRLMMFEQYGSAISWPFLTVLVFWICMLFLGFGLLARVNATLTVAMFIGALSVGGAIFLILELNQPYEGFMRVSDQPLRDALVQLGR